MLRRPLLTASLLVLSGLAAQAETKVVTARNPADSAVAGFQFKDVPLPHRGDAAESATFTVIDGQRDPNGAEIDKLKDGSIPAEGDQPSRNFFFGRSDGGRVLVDLGRNVDIAQINTYSWHPATRGPQVYKLYASDGKAPGFEAQPKRPTDPAKAGWKLVANVDTRSKGSAEGGQYGVSISDTMGSVGQYRYLLFDIDRTETADPFGNTFYSEVDVIDRAAPALAQAIQATVDRYEIEGGKYRFTLDTSETPELTEWARTELTPVVQKWYPMIVQMLPSDGYEAPKQFSITFSKDMKGVAVTAGTRIFGALSWYKNNLKGEANGSIVHELVHVVQQYGRGKRPPGWMIEGIPDYIRFFIYEPQTHGAEISPAGASRARYDASYRTSANFLNWVSGKYDKELVRKLNAAMREGTFTEELWTKLTGHTVLELADEWKTALQGKSAATAAAQ